MDTITKPLVALLALTVTAASPIAHSSLSSRVANEQVSPSGFTRVESSGEENRYFFTFTTNVRTYTIRNDGWAESGSAKILRRNFQLKMGRKGQLTRLYYLEQQRDLLLVYEINDGDFGWGFIERMDQADLQPRWITAFNGFNVGPGLVDENAAYLSAANILAKIDLSSGKYSWRQEGFREERRLPFSGFRTPIVSGDHVLFQEDGDSGRTIEVDKATGRIITSQN